MGMACKEGNVKMQKKNYTKRYKFLNNLKPGWVPPDGGWGWIIVVASGLSNVFIVALNVCFGLIFRERFEQYGISASQTTMLINFNAAVASFIGLTNGPLFKKYTFRQAGFVAAFVSSLAICTLAFTKNFYEFFFFYSILYASGKSVLMSASMLSLISYFAKKRRIAVGLSWVFSGLGNITSPQIATLLMSTYGAFGTIVLFGGISLHTLICSVLMQPVQMNAKRSPVYEKIKSGTEEQDEKANDVVINRSKIILSTEKAKNRSKYYDKIEKRSRQHFGKNNEQNELEIPLVTCTENNRIVKLNPSREIMETNCNQPVSMVFRRKSSLTDLKIDKPNQNLNRQISDPTGSQRKPMDMDEEAIKITYPSKNTHGIENHENDSYGNVHENDEKWQYLLEKGSTAICQEVLEQKQNRLTWWNSAFRTVVAFFDLDLLQDFVSVNIMISVSFVFIIEINFLILTPYILADYGLTDSQIAIIMSIAGGVDVLTRLIISVVASRIGWKNRTFMFIGVGLSALGHAALAHVNTYNVILGIAVISSMGKGISFVFSALILPDHVSLEKLPAAMGLQLMTRGVLSLTIGPIIGWIRDTSGSYTLTLHFLNIFSYYMIISGIMERCCSPKGQRRK